MYGVDVMVVGVPCTARGRVGIGLRYSGARLLPVMGVQVVALELKSFRLGYDSLWATWLGK